MTDLAVSTSMYRNNNNRNEDLYLEIIDMKAIELLISFFNFLQCLHVKIKFSSEKLSEATPINYIIV